MEKQIENIDVIVIGAGPAGIASAITIARAGNKVLVMEKSSHFGIKNMYGGAIYLNSVQELVKNVDIPYDRVNVSHNYVILNDENSINVSYKNKNSKTSATITRFNFDTYLSEIAKKEGVFFAKNTLVVDLIKENNAIKGVKTEYEEIRAKAVILAEGFNSILAVKYGFKKKIEPKSAILGVKEVISLPKEIINKRFNLEDKEGAIYQFFGGLHKENEEIPMGMGFLYTYKNFVTVGAGISMESLKSGKIPPYVYLERLKKHPFVSDLIKDGEILEYQAHSIPEGGYNELPKLYDNGILLVGDCANLVDSPHFEGTNLAIKSGILAGNTINLAIKKNDFSKKTLKKYKKDMYKSFVIQDLKTYRNLIKTLILKKEFAFSYLPKKADEFFEMFTSTKDKGKKLGYRKFISSLFADRCPFKSMCDVISFVKCVFEAVI